MSENARFNLYDRHSGGTVELGMGDIDLIVAGLETIARDVGRIPSDRVAARNLWLRLRPAQG